MSNNRPPPWANLPDVRTQPAAPAPPARAPWEGLPNVAPARPRPPPPPSRGLMDIAGDALGTYVDTAVDVATAPAKVALHTASKLGAMVPGGLSYVGTRLARNIGSIAGENGDRVYRDRQGRLIDEADQAAQAVMAATMDGVTYEPESGIAARAGSRAVDTLMEIPGRILNAAGSGVANVTGSPAAGAATNVGLNLLATAAGARPLLRQVRAATQRGPTVRGYARDVRDAWQRTTPAQRLLTTRPTAARVVPELAPVSAPAALTAPDMVPTTPEPPAAPSAWAQPAGTPARPTTAPVLRQPPPPARQRLPVPVAALRGTGDVLRALTSPLRAAGPDEVALATLLRFGVKPEDLLTVTSDTSPTGAKPMLGEQMRSIESRTGASRLQMQVQQDPMTAGWVNQIDRSNQLARASALEDLTGRPEGLREAATAARTAAGAEEYGRAREVPVRFDAMDPATLERTQGLFSKPAIQAAREAIIDVDTTSAPAGASVADPTQSIGGLHRMQQVLQDEIAAAEKGVHRNPQLALGRMNVEALRAVRGQLVDLIESISPEYATARQNFRERSAPIDRYSVLEGVADSAIDLSVPDETGAVQAGISIPRLDTALRPAAQEGLINSTLKRYAGGRTRLADVLTPDQLTQLLRIRDEGIRRMDVSRLGNGQGSATSRNLYAQQLVDSIGWLGEFKPVENVVHGAQNIVQHFATRGATPGLSPLQEGLAQVVTDPARARAVYLRVLERANYDRAQAGLPPLKPGEVP